MNTAIVIAVCIRDLGQSAHPLGGVVKEVTGMRAGLKLSRDRIPLPSQTSMLDPSRAGLAPDCNPRRAGR